MNYSIKKYRNILFISLASSLLILGCSSKNEGLASSNTIDKFHKDTQNSQIKNSKNMHKYTMRPYSVFGIKYYPFVAKIGNEFKGIASWYGPDFHAKKTSNGEIYNMHALTAAHKTLPMNSVVEVENLENGKSVIVRVNDRGPFVKGRIIDLSNKAAHSIDMVRKGIARVKITLLGYNGEIENSDAPVVPIVEKEKVFKSEEKVEVIKPVVIKEKSIVISDNYRLQVGAFSKVEGAFKIRDKYQNLYSHKKVEVRKVFTNGKYLYKVFIVGFETKQSAENFKLDNDLYNTIVVKN